MKDVFPFLKWVGGKTQILDKVFAKFPNVIDNYYEPFLGGGAILCELLNRLENQTISVKGIYVNDINRHLIDTYITIKDNVIPFEEKLRELNNQYKNANPISEKEPDTKRKLIKPKDTIEENINSGKDYVFYFYRERFNLLKTQTILTQQEIIEKSALFVFINKTCFRGLYREGKNKKYNVPFGNYKNVEIYDNDNLLTLSLLFNKYKVVFNCDDFTNFLNDCSISDFVYLDPPYYPVDENSFTSYNEVDFLEDNHNSLIDVCKSLDTKQIGFLLSNSDTPFIKDKLNTFKIDIIECRRSINSKNPSAKINEVLISNF